MPSSTVEGDLRALALVVRHALIMRGPEYANGDSSSSSVDRVLSSRKDPQRPDECDLDHGNSFDSCTPSSGHWGLRLDIDATEVKSNYRDSGGVPSGQIFHPGVKLLMDRDNSLLLEVDTPAGTPRRQDSNV